MIKEQEQTKKSKISRVYDGLRVGFPCQVVESRMTTANVGNAKDSAMNRIKKFGLCVGMCRTWKRGRSLTGGSGSGTRRRLHDRDEVEAEHRGIKKDHQREFQVGPRKKL
jgi:hypothetical protein